MGKCGKSLNNPLITGKPGDHGRGFIPSKIDKSGTTKSRRTIFAMVLSCAIFMCGTTVYAQKQAAAQRNSVAASACDEPPYHALDFWVGDWDVFDSGDSSKAGESS